MSTVLSDLYALSQPQDTFWKEEGKYRTAKPWCIYNAAGSDRGQAWRLLKENVLLMVSGWSKRCQGWGQEGKKYGDCQGEK